MEGVEGAAELDGPGDQRHRRRHGDGELGERAAALAVRDAALHWLTRIVAELATVTEGRSWAKCTIEVNVPVALSWT